MAPAESVDSGGVKLMVMKEHINSAPVPCPLSLSPKRQLSLLEHTDIVKLQEKSPSSVTEVQRFEVAPERKSIENKNENENKNISPDPAPGPSPTQKTSTRGDTPKDAQDKVLKAKDQNTEPALNTGSPPPSPSSRRRKDSSIERIEVEGKFEYSLKELSWKFKGEWVFKDPSEEHDALSFEYRFPCPDTAQAATETDSKENVALQLPEKTHWSGSFSNQMRRNNKVVTADVAEAFDLTVSAVGGTGSDTEFTASGTGRNKFGTFTIAGTILGDAFNGVKEYYKIREPSGSVSLRRRRSRDSKPRDRYEPCITSKPSSEHSPPSSPAPSPKPKPKPKSARPAASDDTKSESKRKKKRGHVRSKPCSSSKSRKRPREALKLKITAPKSNVSKKARARKHIKAYLNAVTAFAELKAEAKNRSMHTIPTLHAPGVRPRQRMSSRSMEKLRKILAQWNAGNGQFASPATTFFELGYLFKSIQRGKLKEKVLNGYGSCAFINGYCYEGEFVKGAMSGRGILSDSAGSIMYQGDFHENRIHGTGTFFFKNGNRFDGEWREGCISGYGLLREANGNTYLGEWSRNKRHGLGLARFSDGSVYDGEWVEDEMHGKGALHVEGVLDYEGGFKRGQFDGRGQCSYAEGGSYEGMFKAGLKDGRGAYAFSNGALHEGRFRNDRIDGTGFLKMEKNTPVKLANDDVLVPIACKTEMRFIHLKAGFSENGH